MKATRITTTLFLFAATIATRTHANHDDRRLRRPGHGVGGRPSGGGRPHGNHDGKPDKDGGWGGHGSRPCGSDFGPPAEEDIETLCADFNCTDVLTQDYCPQPGSHGYHNHTHGHGDHDILMNHTEGGMAEKRLSCRCCRNNTMENGEGSHKPLGGGHHNEGRPGGRPHGHGGFLPSDTDKDEICMDFNCTKVLEDGNCGFPHKGGCNHTRLLHHGHEEGMNQTHGFREKRLACWCCKNNSDYNAEDIPEGIENNPNDVDVDIEPAKGELDEDARDGDAEEGTIASELNSVEGGGVDEISGSNPLHWKGAGVFVAFAGWMLAFL